MPLGRGPEIGRGPLSKDRTIKQNTLNGKTWIYLRRTVEAGFLGWKMRARPAGSSGMSKNVFENKIKAVI
jgi:hypothetical protein